MKKFSEEALRAELERLEVMKKYENEYREKYGDAVLLCGVDEAGRGPLAGPVVAGACILRKDDVILRLNDSKKLSEKAREELFPEIKENALAWNVGIVSPQTIDEINILQATYEAMRQAIAGLSTAPDYLLNDALIIPGIYPGRQEKIIHGDAVSVSIAAASILAKVTRDHMMVEYDKLYPEYGFAKHKGYGTKAHYEAVYEYGLSPIHRMSFMGSFFTNYHVDPADAFKKYKV